MISIDIKILKYVFLTAALLFAVAGCSLTKTDATTAQAGNPDSANNAQSPGDSQSARTTDNAAATAGGTSSGGLQQSAEPDALIRDLYKTHDEDLKGNGDRILNGESREMLDRYFDKTLADYFWKDLTARGEEVGVLDFDPFYNAQDFDLKNFAVGQAKIEGEKASVPVSFTNAGRQEKLTYALARQPNAGWKIIDIKYTNGDTLLGYFKEDAKNNSAQKSDEEGMFEGTFQIGETTATVKPIKMAFELKWAKGAGTMIFFYEGQGVLKYVSEDKGKGVDAFIFDDATYKTGKFIRGSDGREMPVRKIK